MFEIPTSIFIDGVEHPIRNRGDFRMVLDCFDALEDYELDENYRVIAALIIFYDGMTCESDLLDAFGDKVTDAFNKMVDFFNCGSKQSIGSHSNYKLIDWKADSQLIASAVNSVANTEVRFLPFLHWWTFMGYYTAVGESVFSTVVSIRSKLKKGKKLEDYEKEFKRDNPQYFVWDSQTLEQKQNDELIRQLWNNGGL